MEFETITLDLEEARKYKGLIEDDYEIASKILQINPYEEYDWETFVKGLEAYPVMESLPIEAIIKAEDFDIKFERDWDPQNLSDIAAIYSCRNILLEQFTYLYSYPTDCEVKHVISASDGRRYGGAFLFWNEAFPDQITMQGITKYLGPQLLSILSPNGVKIFPPLNSLIMPKAILFAREKGARKIVVFPIGKQGDILKKYYGFVEPESMPSYSCKMIRGSDIEYERKYLVKYI